MEGTEVVRQLEELAVLALDREDLEKLLHQCDTIRADDTCIAGLIRILSIEGNIVVQEQTQDGEVLIRRLDSREAAERFVEHRLAAYERMWDGCGCKIDYHLD